MTARSDQLKTIFTRALERRSPADREAYLDESCAGNADLRAQVDALLKAHDLAGSFLEEPAVDRQQIAPPQPIAEKPGTIIGPYKLLQEIGEGGMGVVYMAEQTEPVQRRVALKIIKPGMDTRQVIARFQAEEQALAMMDHPNIAKVLDAGATGEFVVPASAGSGAADVEDRLKAALQTGRPYFVMELVKGVPITQYCDEHQLTPQERLELFVPVCHAVQHAHQKGIIHRDIKPTNVLVAEYDDRPVPKIIDFGVAKAIDQRLTEKSMFTALGQVVGTIDYMSPEQAKLNQLDIDTRSDIYSLGVLLYELLTGETPLDRQRLHAAAFDEMLRMIREEEPPRPSLRLSSSASLAAIAACRQTEPKKLSTLVRGELDWIVMKALEKDRNRRYETANAFAHDLENYLHDEPVLACPPSAAHRLRKFARRNRGPVLAVGLVLLALVAGIIGTTWGLVRAENARRDAVAAELAEAERAEGERQAKQEAQASLILAENARRDAVAAQRKEEERAEGERKASQEAQASEAETRAVLDFVENKIFAAARPKGREGGLGHDVSLHEAIEAALPVVEQGFAGRPLIEARLRMTLGTSFCYLGEAKIAVEQFQAARSIYSKLRGPDHDATLRARTWLARSYHEVGRISEAAKLNQETLALTSAKRGRKHPDTLQAAHNLANGYSALGRHADALRLREETLELQKAELGLDHPHTLGGMDNLANSYSAMGRNADALKLRQQALALWQAKLGPDHPDTLRSMSNVASEYYRLHRYAEALKLGERIFVLRKTRLGPVHPETLKSMSDVASCYDALGRNAEGLKLHEEALALKKTHLGRDHPDTLSSMTNVAICLGNVGRHADALKLYEETLALLRARHGPDHPDTLRTMDRLACSYGAAGQEDRHFKLHEETLALWKAQFGPDDRNTLQTMAKFAACHFNVGRHAEGLKLQEETLALQKAKLGPNHPDTLASMDNVAAWHSILGRHADALRLHNEALAVRRSSLGPDHPDTLKSMGEAALSLGRLKRGDEAAPLIDEFLKGTAGKGGDPRVVCAIASLRLRQFEKTNNPAGCRAMAELVEQAKPTDPTILYNLACMRAVTAAVIRAGDGSETAAKEAASEADRAMTWLKQAVAAGWKNTKHGRADNDLAALRGRDDFQKLLADLEADKK